MNPYNPYQAPMMNDPSMGPDGAAPNDAAMAVILGAMKKTRPWVLFLSILGFLGAGAMMLMGLIVMVAGSAAAAMTKAVPGLGPALGLVYIVLGGMYVVPSILMWRYASSIGDLTRSGGSMDALATAVQKQASFWRFVGIMTAGLIALYAVAIVIGVVVGVMMAVGRH